MKNAKKTVTAAFVVLLVTISSAIAFGRHINQFSRDPVAFQVFEAKARWDIPIRLSEAPLLVGAARESVLEALSALKYSEAFNVGTPAFDQIARNDDAIVLTRIAFRFPCSTAVSIWLEFDSKNLLTRAYGATSERGCL